MGDRGPEWVPAVGPGHLHQKTGDDHGNNNSHEGEGSPCQPCVNLLLWVELEVEEVKGREKGPQSHR